MDALGKLTLKELRSLADKKKIKNYSGLKKAELIDKIKEKKTTRKALPIDPNQQKFKDICNKFIGHKITLIAKFSFDGKTTKINNCNAVGEILEDVFYERFKKAIKTLEEGPKQDAPDYWTHNKKYEYEQKVFMKSPCFDISNYRSYIEQLARKNGVMRKLFKTKYIVFKYDIVGYDIILKSFDMLNVWNIVVYGSKYPITIQNKKGMWYNIRPSSPKDWYNKEKTPDRFIESIIESIRKCPNDIPNKDEIIDNISDKYKKIKKVYKIK